MIFAVDCTCVWMLHIVWLGSMAKTINFHGYWTPRDLRGGLTDPFHDNLWSCLPKTITTQPPRAINPYSLLVTVCLFIWNFHMDYLICLKMETPWTFDPKIIWVSARGFIAIESAHLSVEGKLTSILHPPGVYIAHTYTLRWHSDTKVTSANCL